MTFNMWFGGTAGGQPLEQSAEVIRAAHADIVGIQEGSRFPAGEHVDNAHAVANMLGWHYVAQGRNRGIMSRFPIVDQTAKLWGARIEVPGYANVWAFNTHFAHAPYQPFQLLGIPYADAPFLNTAEEAIAAAAEARAKHATDMLAEINAVSSSTVSSSAVSGSATVFVTGDFNEPSPLDWTTQAVAAGRCPMVVDWPTANAFYADGFVDTYRHAHPDPVASPGWTWTSITPPDDPTDHPDRIDFVMVRAAEAEIIRTEIVGESDRYADIVVSPYPSDHRAVVSTVRLR